MHCLYVCVCVSVCLCVQVWYVTIYVSNFISGMPEWLEPFVYSTLVTLFARQNGSTHYSMATY